MASPSSTEVLIVGGGPTGLVLALELAVQGVPFRIIDKNPVASDKSRALGLQPRSLELLGRYGNIRELVSHAFDVRGFKYVVYKKLVTTINSTEIGFEDTVFKRGLILHQTRTEGWLRERLAAYGAAVERGVEATHFRPDAEGVTVQLVKKTADDGSQQQETVRCGYCVGCDGAHSAVRKAAGIAFVGDRYPSEFALCDARIRMEAPARPLEHVTVCMGASWILVLPTGEDRVRMGIITHKGDNSAPTLDEFREQFDRMVPVKAEIHDPEWLCRFRLHHRIASTFRAGRLFVAGDAAHIHSPLGGQGMNTGIQDAINLGWKIGCVIRQEKPESFLDTYNEERRRVGSRVLRTTDRWFTFLGGMNWLMIRVRNFLVPWILPWVFRKREKRTAWTRFVQQLDIKYRHSSAVQHIPGVKTLIKAGDRAPDGRLESPEGKEAQLQELFRGPHHHVVVFSGLNPSKVIEEAMTGFAESARRRELIWERATFHRLYAEEAVGGRGFRDVENQLHLRFGVTEASYALVRPDGYVAEIGPLPLYTDVDFIGVE